VLEVHVELAAHLPIGVVGYANPARLRDALEPRGDVHAVAENIVVLDDDVADMNADADLDPLVGRDRSIAFGHTALNLDGAARRIDRAAEFDQDAIAGPLDDAAAVLGDLGLQEFAAMGVQSLQRAFLVGSHQPAVAHDVAGKNRGQPSLRSL